MASELFGVEGEANGLWSGELAPTDPEERTWNAANAAFVWAVMAVSLPVYLVASGMVALGMSVGAVLGSVLMGSIVAAALAMGCGHAGARYGIPFAVLARMAFGVLGAKVPVALRVLVGCAWVGIGCWLGGEAGFAMLRLLAPRVPPAALWVCFGAFLLAAATPLRRDWKPVAGVLLGACFLLTHAISVWIELHTRGTIVLAIDPSPLLPGRWSPGRETALAVTSLLGLCLPVALGACDFARRVRTQRAQVLSVCAMPIAMVLFCGVASAIAALAVGRGELYWNPVLLDSGMTKPGFAFICLAWLMVTALLAARPVCGWLGGQIAELMPSLISAATGRWLVCLAAVLAAPWRWVASPERYLGGWLTVCAGLLAPVAAILLMEYFVLRRRWLNVADLYQREGLYEYSGGWNWKAFGAMGAGWAMMLAVVFAPALERAQDGAVWLGTGVSALLYWLLRSGPPDVAQIPPTPLLIPLAGFESEGASG